MHVSFHKDSCVSCFTRIFLACTVCCSSEASCLCLAHQCTDWCKRTRDFLCVHRLSQNCQDNLPERMLYANFTMRRPFYKNSPSPFARKPCLVQSNMGGCKGCQKQTSDLSCLYYAQLVNCWRWDDAD
jgi:hypothetical protein